MYCIDLTVITCSKLHKLYRCTVSEISKLHVLYRCTYQKSVSYIFCIVLTDSEYLLYIYMYVKLFYNRNYMTLYMYYKLLV